LEDMSHKLDCLPSMTHEMNPMQRMHGGVLMSSVNHGRLDLILPSVGIRGLFVYAGLFLISPSPSCDQALALEDYELVGKWPHPWTIFILMGDIKS
jgi:hypothetical protein